MGPRSLDADIDRLYQLPLEEFTAARNALAKDAGPDAARIRALVKPPLAAWAVNQLYWQDRKTWDTLVAAAENAQRAHKAVLAGRSGDVRAAGKVHDEAIEAALKATVALLAKTDHPVTDATKHAISTTIRALPGAESPGRLTQAVQPMGFEMLTGLSVAPGAAKPAKPAPQRPAPQKAAKGDPRVLVQARQAVAAAAQAIRDAEHAIKREEFEVARTTREQERAERGVEDANDALARAKTDLERAEAAAKTAARQREAAETRGREARQALTDARRRAESAESSLKKVEKS
jgi:hypothetical protein